MVEELNESTNETERNEDRIFTKQFILLLCNLFVMGFHVSYVEFYLFTYISSTYPSSSASFLGSLGNSFHVLYLTFYLFKCFSNPTPFSCVTFESSPRDGRIRNSSLHILGENNKNPRSQGYLHSIPLRLLHSRVVLHSYTGR